MKATLDIKDQLLAKAKRLAAQQRTSLTRLIEEGLALRLRAQSEPKSAKLRLPVLQGRKGLVAGVDPLSNRSLRKCWAMTPDVVVLIAAARADHPHHAGAATLHLGEHPVNFDRGFSRLMDRSRWTSLRPKAGGHCR